MSSQQLAPSAAVESVLDLTRQLRELRAENQVLRSVLDGAATAEAGAGSASERDLLDAAVAAGRLARAFEVARAQHVKALADRRETAAWRVGDGVDRSFGSERDRCGQHRAG